MSCTGGQTDSNTDSVLMKYIYFRYEGEDAHEGQQRMSFLSLQTNSVFAVLGLFAALKFSLVAEQYPTQLVKKELQCKLAES